MPWRTSPRSRSHDRPEIGEGADLRRVVDIGQPVELGVVRGLAPIDELQRRTELRHGGIEDAKAETVARTEKVRRRAGLANAEQRQRRPAELLSAAPGKAGIIRPSAPMVTIQSRNGGRVGRRRGRRRRGCGRSAAAAMPGATTTSSASASATQRSTAWPPHPRWLAQVDIDHSANVRGRRRRNAEW